MGYAIILFNWNQKATSKMHKIITHNQDALKQLCRQYHVKKLEVFGSVTRDDFNTEKSDIDFLVEFNDIASTDYADNYFNFHSALHQLFNISVELVVSSTIKNPYFLKSIELDKRFLYAA